MFGVHAIEQRGPFHEPAVVARMAQQLGAVHTAKAAPMAWQTVAIAAAASAAVGAVGGGFAATEGRRVRGAAIGGAVAGLGGALGFALAWLLVPVKYTWETGD